MCTNTSAAMDPRLLHAPCLCSNRRFFCRKLGFLQDQQESTLPVGDEGLSVITGNSWKLLQCYAQRPFLCKLTYSTAAYIRGHQKQRCEKPEKAALHHLPLQKERERDKGKRGLCVLESQSFPSVLETKLTVVRKEQSHLKASLVGFGSSVRRKKMHSQSYVPPGFPGHCTLSL